MTWAFADLTWVVMELPSRFEMADANKPPQRPRTPLPLGHMTTSWEYATVPLLTHATKQILDTWGEDGWELVTVLPGPTGEQHIAYMKRAKEA